MDGPRQTVGAAHARARCRTFLNGLLLCVVAAIPGVAPAQARAKEDLAAALAATLKVVGPPEEVGGETECGGGKQAGGRDVPDMPAKAFRDSDGTVHLIAGNKRNIELSGADLSSVTKRCHQLLRSAESTAPASFSNFEWVMSPYTEDGRHVVALVHNEYHGDLYDPSCAARAAAGPKNRKHCWYASITSVQSNDGGKTWERIQGPARIVAVLPYRFSPDMERAGLSDPTNIVRNPADGKLYAMMVANAYGLQSRGMCLLRGDGLDFSAWRAWGGRAFDVQFVDPYAQPVANPGQHVCMPVLRWQVRGLTFNTYLNVFLAIGTDPEKDVLYSFSSDLVHWSPPKTLAGVSGLTVFPNGDEEGGAYFSLLDPASPARNFDTTGQRPYLYFVNFETNPDHPRNPTRRLLRIPLEVTR